MKCAAWSLIIACMLAVPALQAQQQPQPPPPTLGPAEPSLEGPNTATTTDRSRLIHMRTIYIERIDNQLSDKLIDDLSGSALIRVVDKPGDADAILRGTCFSSRHLKQVHSEVFISDRSAGTSIWQDVVRVPFDPPAISKAVDNTAAEVLRTLPVASAQPAVNRLREIAIQWLENFPAIIGNIPCLIFAPNSPILARRHILI